MAPTPLAVAGMLLLLYRRTILAFSASPANEAQDIKPHDWRQLPATRVCGRLAAYLSAYQSPRAASAHLFSDEGSSHHVGTPENVSSSTTGDDDSASARAYGDSLDTPDHDATENLLTPNTPAHWILESSNSQDGTAEPDRPYFCHCCDRRFFDEKGLRAHVRQKHDRERGFRCLHSSCANRPLFSRRCNFRSHVKSQHHSTKLPDPSLQAATTKNTRFARGCGLCLEVFTDLSIFLSHHVQHCKAGSTKKQWSTISQIEALLSQVGLLDLWTTILLDLSNRPEEFIRWCLRFDRNLLRHLEGNPSQQSHRRHVASIRLKLSGLYSQFKSLVPGGRAVDEAALGIFEFDNARSQHTAPAPGISGYTTTRTPGRWSHGQHQEPYLAGSAQQRPYDFQVEFAHPSDGEHLPGPGQSDSGSTSQVPRFDDADAGIDKDNSSGWMPSPPETRPHPRTLAAAWQSLRDEVQAGIVPAATDGTGLLCGMRAFVGSVNDALQRRLRAGDIARPLNLHQIMQAMFADYDPITAEYPWAVTLPARPGIPTPEYRAFLESTLLPLHGATQYDHLWRELISMNNIGVEHFRILPEFLRQRGLLDHVVAIGVASAGGRRLDGQWVTPGAYILQDRLQETPVAWIHNDNAESLDGTILNHWSMFREGGDLSHVLQGVGPMPVVGQVHNAIGDATMPVEQLPAYDWCSNPPVDTVFGVQADQFGIIETREVVGPQWFYSPGLDSDDHLMSTVGFGAAGDTSTLPAELSIGNERLVHDPLWYDVPYEFGGDELVRMDDPPLQPSTHETAEAMLFSSPRRGTSSIDPDDSSETGDGGKHSVAPS